MCHQPPEPGYLTVGDSAGNRGVTRSEVSWPRDFFFHLATSHIAHIESHTAHLIPAVQDDVFIITCVYQ